MFSVGSLKSYSSLAFVQLLLVEQGCNQTSKTDVKGMTYSTYDKLNKLQTVTEPNGKITTYTFDKAGNRLTELVTGGSSTVTTAYAYNRQNRLITTVTQANQTTEKVTYAYDANGNMFSKTRRTTKPPGPDADEEYFFFREAIRPH